MKHVTVLKTEAVDALNISTDSVVVDATFGGGGHGEKILSILGKKGTYIGIDADKNAFQKKPDVFESADATVHLVTDNFRNIGDILDRLKIMQVDAVLADLGWRTEQLTEGTKGLSFDDAKSLSMTYGDPEDYTFTAYDIVNEWDEEHIADVIFGYGEERQSRRIARAIIRAREEGEIKSAAQLASSVADAIPKRFHPRRIHPATRTFQALRIAVNDELGSLGALIEKGFSRLRTGLPAAPGRPAQAGGRMAVITFHSIEDRLVKRLFANYARDQKAIMVTKKPVTATKEELSANPRARSAKLRVIEKT